MPQEFQTAEQTHTYRPLFLSILCVLGFIGSIASIVQNSVGIFKADDEVVQIQSGSSKTQLKNIFGGKAAVSQPMSISNLTPDNFQKFSIGDEANSDKACKNGANGHPRARYNERKLFFRHFTKVL